MLPLTCNDRHKLLTRLVESFLIILRSRASLYTKSLKKKHLQKRCIIVYCNSFVTKWRAAVIMWELLNNNNMIAQHCNYRFKTIPIHLWFIIPTRGIIKAGWHTGFTSLLLQYCIFIDRCIKWLSSTLLASIAQNSFL